MKKILALLLTLILVLTLSACGNTSTSPETDASTPKNTNESQSETTNTTSDDDENTHNEEFVPNAKLTCVAGDNFKLPINGQDNQFAEISDFSATKYKIADINNKSDYWGHGDMIYFNNYLYKIKFNGKVDPQFAGKQIYVSFQFESYNEFFGAGGNKEKVIVNSDGTFSSEFIAYSNINENTIIPHHAYINNSNF